MNQEEEYNNSLKRTEEALEEYCNYLGGVTFEPSPKYADYDYKILINGKLSHFLEVKTRRNKLNDYAQTKLPLRKHTFAEHCFRHYAIKTYFLVSFTDCLGLIDLTNEPDREAVQIARHDRGEEEDIYAYYNVSNIKKI
jgi:alpha-glucuronidase